MGTVKEDLAKLLKLRQFKADYLAKIEAIKQGEEVLTRRILKTLEDNGVDSIKTDGYTLSKSCKDHFEIADKEKFLTAMYNDMADAKAHGQSLATACLLQQRPAKTLLKDLIIAETGADLAKIIAKSKDLTIAETGDDLAKIIAKSQELGLNYVVESDLSVRKVK